MNMPRTRQVDDERRKSAAILSIFLLNFEVSFFLELTLICTVSVRAIGYRSRFEPLKHEALLNNIFVLIRISL
jgi:hypothetical protein